MQHYSLLKTIFQNRNDKYIKWFLKWLLNLIYGYKFNFSLGKNTHLMYILLPFSICRISSRQENAVQPRSMGFSTVKRAKVKPRIEVNWLLSSVP